MPYELDWSTYVEIERMSNILLKKDKGFYSGSCHYATIAILWATREELFNLHHIGS
jgi:hypothetical protein